MKLVTTALNRMVRRTPRVTAFASKRNPMQPPAMTKFDTEKPALPSSQADPNRLMLDAHTLKDLEIFGTETGKTSLFQFCNLTRTSGAAQVLHRRMEQPFSNADQIRATQQSISFILERRQAFTKLPAYIAIRVQHYTRDILPVVVKTNLLEFSIDAFSLWATHNRHYFKIRLGVQVTCSLIRALRRFLSQPELAAPVGELAPLVAEMRELLSRPRLVQVPDRELGSWAWRTLRYDQVFRVHERGSIDRLQQLIYEVDALIAMADVTSKNGFVLPQVEEGPLRIHAEGLVHPFVLNPVANPVNLDQERLVLFLTGPNMAGKTTYLRAFATALYLAHMGMGVPASSFRFAPAQRLFSSISLNDDLSNGVSYFRAEALRVKAVAQAVAQGYRVVALMDEPFKGTNVKDALDVSLAILKRFAGQKDCLFMFSSHLIELSKELDVSQRIDRCYFAADESKERLRFDYLLRPGVATQRLGMRVLQEEGVFDLLDARSIGDK